MLQTTVRPKVCVSCGSSFMPFMPMARACSVPCAMKIGRTQTKERAEAKKAERRQDREKRQAMQRLPELKKAAQKAFNTWVRTRDHEQPCISCGAPPPDSTGFHGGRDAGHYRSIGAAAHLRFHENNCHAQCVACNQHKAGNAVDYRIGLVNRIGMDAVKALEADKDIRKWTHDELRAIKASYMAKTKQLKKEQQ